VEPGSGLLSLRGRCPSGGRFPRHFLLDEEAGDLLVANQLSGDVCVFRVDPSGNVAPTPAQRISAPSAAAVMRL
jgi:6-phosphogluconolactonase